MVDKTKFRSLPVLSSYRFCNRFETVNMKHDLSNGLFCSPRTAALDLNSPIFTLLKMRRFWSSQFFLSEAFDLKISG